MKRDGEYTGRIIAPEGERFLVLFTYASGNVPTYENEDAEDAYLYGRMAAQIHTESNAFRSSCDRFILDFSYLADTPLHSIKPMLSNRPEDWEYVVRLTERLRADIQSIPPTALETGFCHGDFHGGNAHLDSGSTLTFFDFDCCGIGWRSYDIAVFLWGARLRGKDKEQWPPFLKGYTEVRHLSDADMRAVNYFVAIRHIWLMGLHTSRGHDWGFGWMNDGYFDRQISFLRQWEADYLAETST
jgi:Ser/Thr protein kinase RdoA (MazF antagonist)